jgi:hypothetical protein
MVKVSYKQIIHNTGARQGGFSQGGGLTKMYPPWGVGRGESPNYFKKHFSSSLTLKNAKNIFSRP